MKNATTNIRIVEHAMQVSMCMRFLIQLNILQGEDTTGPQTLLSNAPQMRDYFFVQIRHRHTYTAPLHEDQMKSDRCRLRRIGRFSKCGFTPKEAGNTNHFLGRQRLCL